MEKEISVRIWEKMTKLYEILRMQQNKSMYAMNLTGPQFSALEVLYRENENRIPLKKLSERLSVSGANITCVVDNLEKDGLVRRVPSKEDRRIIYAEITPKGKQKFEKVFPIHQKNVEKIVESLNADEKEYLERLLDKLIAFKIENIE